MCTGLVVLALSCQCSVCSHGNEGGRGKCQQRTSSGSTSVWSASGQMVSIVFPPASLGNCLVCSSAGIASVCIIQEPWHNSIPSGVKVFGGCCRGGETLKRGKFCDFSYFVLFESGVWALLRGLFRCLQTAPISAGWLWEHQLMELLVLLKCLCIFLASFIPSLCWQVLWGCGEKKGLCKMRNSFHPSAVLQVLSWGRWVSKTQCNQPLTSNLLCQWVESVLC